MGVSCLQNTGQIHNLPSPNKSLENVAEFKHSGITVTNQIVIYEEI
jgi:hypothetical protein